MFLMFRIVLPVGCLVLLLVCSDESVSSRQKSQATSASESPSLRATQSSTEEITYAAERIEAQHLPNVIQLHPQVISGGAPDGEAGFRELQSLGVKTVVSVDGAKPDVELAKKYGMRYVHLPHGYDGIPADCAKQLAKAVRELEGPVYFHCHHGKHRSPAAATVACIGAGLVEPQHAFSILKLAGTSENYQGLYQSAESATPFEEALLAELASDFPETAELPAMAEAMVEIAHTHEHLKEIAAAGWQTPPDHPDLVPAHEALLLREHFTELLRTDEVKEQSERFRQLVHDGEAAAQELETALRNWKQAGKAATPPTGISAVFERVSKGCKTCHAQYRDIPLQQKAR